MSLTKKTSMTDESRAARRRNGRKSRGAATPEGKERIRAANLRHGYYSKVRDEALVSLGEDPAELEALIDGAYEQFQPSNGYQAWGANRLASLQWRIQRAERMQDSVVATHVQEAMDRRSAGAEHVRYQYNDRDDILRCLRRAAARPDFATPAHFFEMFTRAFAGEPSSGKGEILELMHCLREPQEPEPPTEVAAPGAMSDQDWKSWSTVTEENDY